MSANRSSNSIVRNISADALYNANANVILTSTELSDYTEIESSDNNMSNQESEVEILAKKNNFSKAITANASFFGANGGDNGKGNTDSSDSNSTQECHNCCDFLCCRKDKRCPWIMRKNCNKGCLEDICKCRCNRLTPREKKQCGIWTIFIIILLVIAGATFIHLDNERVRKQQLSYKMKEGASKVGQAAVSVKNSVASGANSVRKAAGRAKNKVLGKKKAPWWKFWAPKYE